MYYCYVLQSLKDSGLYIGITKDPKARLEEHNKGTTKSTKGRRPFRIVHVEIYKDRKEARAMEKYLKSGIGREVIKELLLNFGV